MKHKIINTILISIMVLSFSPMAQATSYLPGYEPYTYGYAISLDASQSPAVQYLGYLQGNITSAQWQKWMNGPPDFTYNLNSSFYADTSEVYFFKDNIWIIYYNPEGYSTQVLIIPTEILFNTSDLLF